MKYLLALIGDESRYADRTPEQMREGMKEWDAFTRATTDGGAFVAGEGLQPSATATTVKIQEAGEPIVTDGPFAETKEQLGGFYLLECEDPAVRWRSVRSWTTRSRAPRPTRTRWRRRGKRSGRGGRAPVPGGVRTGGRVAHSRAWRLRPRRGGGAGRVRGGAPGVARARHAA
ncbi:MAG: hypothetical protein E6G07_13355 [Actinobacteria bacterium]|nr:MAG: hypothetical protein E6G07_13355 [Actinomycetota bacterium]